MWLRISTSYVVILRQLKHTKLKLQLQISFFVKIKSQYFSCKMHTSKIVKHLLKII